MYRVENILDSSMNRNREKNGETETRQTSSGRNSSSYYTISNGAISSVNNFIGKKDKRNVINLTISELFNLKLNFCRSRSAKLNFTVTELFMVIGQFSRVLNIIVSSMSCEVLRWNRNIFFHEFKT